MNIIRFAEIFSLVLSTAYCFTLPEAKTEFRCYVDIMECFSNEAPFKDLPIPKAPDAIAPKYYLMQSDRSFRQINSSSELNLDELVLAVHGWRGGYDEKDNSYLAILKNLAEIKPNSDFVFVDWRKGAANGFKLDSYTQPASNTRVVGSMIRQFLESNPKFDPSKTHCIGFSLGAHVCGFFGKSLQTVSGKRLARISALDPANPNFDKSETSARLDSSDADFVDVMHTSWLGLRIPVGHVDFYVNGPNLQPGCLSRRRRQATTIEEYKDDLVACSHSRALYVYAASIKANDANCTLKFCPCESKKDFEAGNCPPCDDEISQQLGYWSYTKSGRGSFYGKTSNKAPYCISENSSAKRKN